MDLEEETGDEPKVPTTSDGNIVVAIIDNNSWEVGMAEIDLLHPMKLCVSQITDDRSFSATLERLRVLEPQEILVPDSHFNRPLAEVLRATYSAKVTAFSRSTFNESRGGEIMNDLAKAQIQTKQHLHSHYLGRAAACALVTFVERSRGGETIKRLVVELDPWMEHHRRLRMDDSTIRALELILNRRTSGKEGTLFSILKRTRTSMGSRLLRGQIISPPTDVHLINQRIDAVSSCIDMRHSNDDHTDEARRALSKMCDLDRVCSRFSTEPKKFTVRELKSEIEAVLHVREFAREFHLLSQSIAELDSELWATIRHFFKEHEELLNELAEFISSITAQPVQSSSRSNHHLQDIFCVKADVDGLLDIARLAYVQVVKDMETLVEELREQTGLQALELKRTAGRGYHLSIPRSCESRLPAMFVQAVRHRKAILCTTPGLASLNNRQARLETEILALTVARLQPLRDRISTVLPMLFKIGEMVALVDMLFGFAEVSEERGYGAPMISEGRNTEISLIESFHPILQSVIDDCVPRDVSFCQEQRLLIVTGENCAGKTTLLTHVGLITVMAHLGCHVPAKKCRLPVFTKLFTRLGTDDALEENASTFSLEMVEMASILQFVQQNIPDAPLALILVDELGRGTSSRDGLAIAAASAEQLLRSPCVRCLFATHFIRLRSLSEIYPEYVQAVLINPLEESVDLENDDYGIRLAEACAMPDTVLAAARDMRTKLMKHFHSDKVDSTFAEATSSPVAELCKVIQAIKLKTQSDTGMDVKEASRLLRELRARLV